MSRKRIFYVTDLVLDDHSAPAIHVDVICTQFAKLGHEVTLCAPRAENIEVSPLYTAQIVRSPRFLLTLWYQPRLFAWLVLEILKKPPDLLYVRHSHLLVVPTIVGRLFRIPVFLEINGILEQDAVHISKTLRSTLFLSLGIFPLLERLNARLATKCIAVTDGIKQYFIEKYRTAAEKIAVIPNGVDTDAFMPDPVAHSGITVGYVGSLHEWQGIRFIVEAARLLPGIRFRIVGDGEMRDYIATQRTANVELLPALPHEKVPQAINAIDICISYPLKFRDGATSPFKIYEYLACGKPVISSDLASMREEFGDVLTYADAESADSLAQGIQELVADPARREALGERGRAFVEKGGSWESVARKIIMLATGKVEPFPRHS